MNTKFIIIDIEQIYKILHLRNSPIITILLVAVTDTNQRYVI